MPESSTKTTKLAATAAAVAMLLAVAACSTDDATTSNVDGTTTTLSASPTTGETPTSEASTTTAMDHSMMTSPSSTAPGPLPAGVNDIDVKFVQDMIPHHQQAVAMSAAVTARGSSAATKTLAEKVAKAQGTEITTMRDWLQKWGRTEHPMGTMDMSSMDGMMTDAEMRTLDATSGAALDKMFVEMMIRHHEGAIAMAENEVAKGESSEVIALAKTIIAAQKAEVASMKAMLPTLG